MVRCGGAAFGALPDPCDSAALERISGDGDGDSSIVAEVKGEIVV